MYDVRTRTGLVCLFDFSFPWEVVQTCMSIQLTLSFTKLALSWLMLSVGFTPGLALPLAGALPDALPWDKPAAVAWEEHADSLSAIRGGTNLAHPVSSLRWATFEDDDESAGSRSWRFVNSAQRAVALPVDWSCVYRTAVEMEADDAAGEPVCVGVVSSATHGSMPALATVADLEMALAAALACRLVLAREVDGAKGVRSQSPPPLDPSLGLRLEGELRRTRVGASLYADPSVVSLSRDTMPLCWPKAFHFAKMLERGGAEVQQRLGAIPVAWGIETRRWEAQHRFDDH